MSSLDNLHVQMQQLLDPDVNLRQLTFSGVTPGILEEHGFTLYEMETNGWQCDYWCDASWNDNIVCLAGSMWYGTVCITLPEKSE